MPNPPSSGLPHPQSYDVDDDIVVDEVTGLAWQRNVDLGPGEAGRFGWQDAMLHCGQLVLGGHDDFRLPTRIELVSIVDPSAQEPAIDVQAFGDAPLEAHWTSSLVAADVDQAYSVEFLSGATSASSRSDELALRCVRNDHQPILPTRDERYHVDGGTVRDRTTGLRWQRSPTTETATRAEARNYCSNLIVNGDASFRLPSMKELQTIVDETQSGLPVDPNAFPDATGGAYWTSTGTADDPQSGWIVRFSDGYADRATLDTAALVRCVR
jgi:hypothetical protein